MSKTNICIQCNSKKELVVCGECFDKYYSQYKQIRQKNEFKIWIIVGIILLVGLILSFVGYITKNVDEDKFCKEKLNKYFPEYNFQKEYYSDNDCVGEFQENQIKRDGLIEQKETKTKTFMLTYQEDKNFIYSDDLSGYIFFVSICILGIYIYLFILSMGE